MDREPFLDHLKELAVTKCAKKWTKLIKFDIFEIPEAGNAVVLKARYSEPFWGDQCEKLWMVWDNEVDHEISFGDLRLDGAHITIHSIIVDEKNVTLDVETISEGNIIITKAKSRHLRLSHKYERELFRKTRYIPYSRYGPGGLSL